MAQFICDIYYYSIPNQACDQIIKNHPEGCKKFKEMSKSEFISHASGSGCTDVKILSKAYDRIHYCLCDRLSIWAIIGIIAGTVLVVGIILFLIFHKKKKNEDSGNLPSKFI